MEKENGEVRTLIIGKKYEDFIGCKDVPPFTMEPCVGGMVSGVQMKWRVRYKEDGEEKVLVVMNGLPFSIADKKYIIRYSEEEKPGLLKGYAVYSLS